MASRCGGHYVLGTEGLALLRGWLSDDESELERRVEELRRFAASSAEAPLSLRFDVEPLDVSRGYERWANVYDAAPNPLIRVEEPVVRDLIDRADPGVALDAACGTGRHTAYLVDRGHRVIGVDSSEAMLERARDRAPEAELRLGDLESLPVDDESVDLAICALALTHLEEIHGAIGELTRAVRPGGRIILSDLHPAMTLLGGTGFFVGADGIAGDVRSHHHPHSRYLRAFREAGLEVVDCIEPVLEEADVVALSGGLVTFSEDAFRSAWVGLPNALVWDLRRPPKT